MFPINQLQGAESLAVVAEIENKNKYGKSFLFDFQIGDFILVDGKVQEIEGEKALKVWIQKKLKTEKVRYKIYEIIDNSYGVSLIDLLNSEFPTGFLYASIQSEIDKALTSHPDIINVTGYEFERSTRGVTVSFSAVTTYGQIDEGVSI